MAYQERRALYLVLGPLNQRIAELLIAVDLGMKEIRQFVYNIAIYPETKV